MHQYNNVMVFGEVAGGTLSAITTELLGCGRKLADDLGEELSVVLMGSNVGSLAQEAIRFGADKAYVVDDPMLKDCPADLYAAVMEKVLKQASPRILILGQTDIGRDLAPRLSFRLGAAATLDCVQLSIDPDSKLLLQTKPVYGGNAFATYASPFYPQIATVRAKTMSPLNPDDLRQGKIIDMEVSLDPSAIRTKILEKLPEATEGIRLEDAKVVVSGGRGIGSLDGFRQLEELAALLNGAVGATRSSCDNGWAPYALQIGITGKIINPDLYIAIALSGASQHLTGVTGKKTIVAINRDSGANIFKEARFGIVGDWQKVLPAFIAKVRELISLC
jgi:electron transfer flavoprotein alpha subunit